MTTYANKVQEWADNYHGNASNHVRDILKQANGGDDYAWSILTKLYEIYQEGYEHGQRQGNS